jgi:hypothetical protein
VDAGEIGAGHEVTALYEVKLGAIGEARADRHGAAALRAARARGRRRRAAGPGDRGERDHITAQPPVRGRGAAPPARRGGRGVRRDPARQLLGEGEQLSDVLPVARSAARALRDDAAAGFVDLLEKAIPLSRTLEPKERVQEP